MNIDLSKHKEAYLKEARSHIKALNRALIELEKNPDSTKCLRSISRAMHTLKSLAATMNYQESMSLCHVVEDVLVAIRNKKLSLNKSADLLFNAFDQLETNLKKVEANEEELSSAQIILKLRELLSMKQDGEHTLISSEIQIEPSVIEKIKVIDVKVERLDKLVNLAEELLVCKLKFDLIKEQGDNIELSTAVETLGRLITDLQYHVLQVRLMPVEFIFTRFIRLVRDLAKIQKKEVDLQLEGVDIELDRLLIDEVSESIAHLIRNAIDHGLETPDSREKNGKSRRGVIRLSARRTKEAAVIEVSDDGAGLDFQAIKKVALDNKLISPAATHDEIKNVIFSDISTKKSITQTSGRGLGLSIVKETIESIGGAIHVESLPQKGTTFFIEIPLTLTIAKMLFVKVSSETYAIPIESVDHLLSLKDEDFKGFLNEEAIILEHQEIPIIRLTKIFGEKPTQQSKQPIVIIHRAGKRLGLAVDSLVATQEIVIKPLSRAVKNNKLFSGAAMIGSGEVVLIIDIAYLLQFFKGKTKVV